MQTVEDAWKMYRTMVLASAKKANQATETGRWNKHISPILGDKAIAALTSLDYLRLRRTLEERRLSPQTVCHCLSLLRRMLKKSVEWGHVDKTIPTFKGTLPKFDNRRQRYLTAKELTMLLDTLKTSETLANWHDIVLFAVNTGMRKGEILSLKPSDIDFDSGFATVADTKSGKNRHVPLNGIACRIALKKAGLNDGITDLRQKAVFHTLRHTFASWLVQAGFPLALVCQLLGHSGISVTMCYAHLAPSQARQAVATIENRCGKRE